jgi:enoyl-CoA hydratase/carnithine racemase
VEFGLPEVGLGNILLGGGYARLLRAVGRSRPVQMVLVGGRMAAREAAERGVFADAELGEDVLRVADEIRRFTAETLALAKEATVRLEDGGLRNGVGVESVICYLSGGTWDLGVATFLEKPKFD